MSTRSYNHFRVRGLKLGKHFVLNSVHHWAALSLYGFLTYCFLNFHYSFFSSTVLIVWFLISLFFIVTGIASLYTSGYALAHCLAKLLMFCLLIGVLVISPAGCLCVAEQHKSSVAWLFELTSHVLWILFSSSTSCRAESCTLNFRNVPARLHLEVWGLEYWMRQDKHLPIPQFPALFQVKNFSPEDSESTKNVWCAADLLSMVCQLFHGFAVDGVSALLFDLICLLNAIHENALFWQFRTEKL